MLEVAFHNPRQHKQFRRDSGPLVLARANQEPALWTTVDEGLACPDARIEIVPQRAGVSLAVAGCEAEYREVPASFTVGDTRFEITLAQTGASHRRLQPLRTNKRTLRDRKSSATGPSPATLSRWFSALSSLNHWDTSLQELYVQAAHCAVEAIGLDGGIVLRRRDDQWEIAASYLPHPELGIHYDVAALDELLGSPETLFHGAECIHLAPREGTPSRSEQAPLCEPAIVVSPLRNAAGELAGAVYGYRSVREGNSRRTIRYLEAHMIELLAGAVSEGIARIEREAETDRRRVLLEQAAAMSQDQSSREIVIDEREVTLLFADLRNSTALAATLASSETYELLSQVMECLTAAVIDHDGLIIDYYGDGLAAMWNAPADQSEHAELACRTALRMLQTLPTISRNWADFLHGELQLGVGIHTGAVHVGNTGTRRRSKYGPRGTNVNLTSRVEAATKQFDVPILVTGATAERLSNRFSTHRICRARMPGIVKPIDLYTVCLAASDAQLSMEWHTYHEALQSFEQGRLQEAADRLATIAPGLGVIPSRFLAEHVNGELARQNLRRSSDRESESSRGVIALNSK